MLTSVMQSELAARESNGAAFHTIVASSVDELVAKGIDHIQRYGERVEVRAGTGLQAYGVNYVLDNPRDRLHTARAGAVKYLCRELLAYFKGSLRAEDGLTHASRFWGTLKNESGEINSNYGYYVFYEPVDGYENQYNWIISRLLQNRDSRRAIININQNYHKSETKDFPCTVSIQLFVRRSSLHCEVSSRSTDVITGLPYDMGFFSFVHELIHRHLVDLGLSDIQLGSTIMKTSFTQIYDRTKSKIAEMASRNEGQLMPEIVRAEDVLSDIYRGTRDTPVIAWIAQHAG
ncbi:hypothetical protein JQ607_28475 [Bradyrhizobium liaoningense]|uniref:thymidylate synthase n=1 Tax=Bradyrhizobium liaoningense TaxID=43992 RepID=UPI001BAD743D|nr:thymidylate synthase [Bradyrhizobium liaoningense]MBR0844153.1 hypothetical protein [Bradyrhizobium liaoningense]